MSITSIRESPRLDLSREIETPTGRFYRWSKDEPRPENVPSGGVFSTTMPGGFDQDSVSLPRKSNVDYSDLGRLSTITARGAGGEIACETRFEKTPRTSGDQFSVGPETKGWIAHLEDDQSAAEIYRDADLGGWQGPSRGFEAALIAANFPPSGPQVVVDASSGIPALQLSVEGHWETVLPVAEAFYDAGPSARVASVAHAWAVSSADAKFELFPFVCDNDLAEGLVAGSDLATGSASGSGTFTPSSAKRFAGWKWAYTSTPAGVDGFTFAAWVSRLAVYGDHGLTLRGTEPEAGFFASDVVADALGRWAPLLNFTTGSAGSIRPTATVIPHLVVKDKTTTLAILEGANAYELRNYAVWENRTFYYNQWGDTGRKWRARVAPSQLSETGPSVDRLRNGVIVSYQDPDGSTRTLGPPGSGCTTESANLADADPENEANQRGLRLWGSPIDLGISVEKVALEVGELFLRRLRETDTSGQAQIVGTCIDDRGIERPAWQVRAGDTIVFVDASDTRERRIVRTTYDDESKTNTLDLDAPPEGAPDLIAQLGVSISDLGL